MVRPLLHREPGRSKSQAFMYCTQQHLISHACRRGIQEDIKYIDDKNVVLIYRMPWQEVVTDLHDVVRVCLSLSIVTWIILLSVTIEVVEVVVVAAAAHFLLWIIASC